MLRLEIADARLTPGHLTRLPLHIANTGPTPVLATVRVAGLDPAWMPTEPIQATIGAGGSTLVDLPVDVPKGYPASSLEVSVEVHGTVAGRTEPVAPARLDVRLVVGRAAGLHAVLQPANVPKSGRFTVRLENGATTPTQVSLTGVAGEGGSLTFGTGSVQLGPGETRDVRGRVDHPRFTTGPNRRLPFTVVVASPGTETPLEGTHTQGPVIRSRHLASLAVLALLVAWAGAMVGGARLLQHKKADSAATQMSGAGSSDGTDGSSADGGSGDGSGDAAGTGKITGGGVDEPNGMTAMTGKVTALDPAGVKVRIEATSLVDPSTFKTAGKLLGGGSAELPPPVNRVTDADGAWSAAGLPAPATYLVAFSKAGYQVQRNVVQATNDGKTVIVDVSLKPGEGVVSGSVLVGKARRGGVDITITNGTTSLATKSSDTDGTWSVDHLATPGSYLVTASSAGFSIESQVVKLTAGGTAPGVTFHLHAGLGSLSGCVHTSIGDCPAGGGIANATVTISSDATTDPSAPSETDEASGESNSVKGAPTDDPDAPTGADAAPVGPVPDVTRTVTTRSDDPGRFTLSDLPIPGGYTVTISGEGFSTSSQHLLLSGNQTLDMPLTRSTSTVSGRAFGKREGSADRPLLRGVGVTLSNEDNTFKTVSTSSYQIDGVPPGTYQATYELYPYKPATQTITVPRGGGDVHADDITLTYLGAGATTTGRIELLVVDRDSGSPIDATASVAAGNAENVVGGSHEITNLAPGVVHVSVQADGFQDQTRTVQVGPTVPVSLTVTMVPLGTLRGAVVSTKTRSPIDKQMVTIDRDVPASAGSTTPSTTTTTTPPNPDPADPCKGHFDCDTTDGIGEFEFARVLSTGRYTLTFAGGHRREKVIKGIRVEAGETNTLSTTELDSYPVIDVHVLDSTNGEQPRPADRTTVKILKAGVVARDCDGEPLEPGKPGDVYYPRGPTTAVCLPLPDGSTTTVYTAEATRTEPGKPDVVAKASVPLAGGLKLNQELTGDAAVLLLFRTNGDTVVHQTWLSNGVATAPNHDVPVTMLPTDGLKHLEDGTTEPAEPVTSTSSPAPGLWVFTAEQTTGFIGKVKVSVSDSTAFEEDSIIDSYIGHTAEFRLTAKPGRVRGSVVANGYTDVPRVLHAHVGDAPTGRPAGFTDDQAEAFDTTEPGPATPGEAASFDVATTDVPAGDYLVTYQGENYSDATPIVISVSPGGVGSDGTKPSDPPLFCGSAPKTACPVLTELITLKLTTTPGATVTLTGATGKPLKCPETIATDDDALCATRATSDQAAGTWTWTHLDPTQPLGWAINAAGYESEVTTSPDALDLHLGENDVVNQLDKLGSISGVLSLRNGPHLDPTLALGMKVTAECISASCHDGSTFETTTDSTTGDFTLTGGPNPEDNGLFSGRYKLTVATDTDFCGAGTHQCTVQKTDVNEGLSGCADTNEREPAATCEVMVRSEEDVSGLSVLLTGATGTATLKITSLADPTGSHPSDAPLEGARVTIKAKQTGTEVTQNTDDKGLVSWSGLESDDYLVTVSAATHHAIVEADGVSVHVAPGGDSPSPITIPLAWDFRTITISSIEQTIGDQRDVPLSGVSVTITNAAGEKRTSTSSECPPTQSSCMFLEMEDGTYTITASKAGYEDAVTVQPFVLDLNHQKFDFRAILPARKVLARPFIVKSGADDRPIVGATVVFRGRTKAAPGDGYAIPTDSTPVSGVSTAGGKLAMNLYPGTYDVTIDVSKAEGHFGGPYEQHGIVIDPTDSTPTTPIAVVADEALVNVSVKVLTDSPTPDVSAVSASLTSSPPQQPFTIGSPTSVGPAVARFSFFVPAGSYKVTAARNAADPTSYDARGLSATAFAVAAGTTTSIDDVRLVHKVVVRARVLEGTAKTVTDPAHVLVTAKSPDGGTVSMDVNPNDPAEYRSGLVSLGDVSTSSETSTFVVTAAWNDKPAGSADVDAHGEAKIAADPASSEAEPEIDMTMATLTVTPDIASFSSTPPPLDVSATNGAGQSVSLQKVGSSYEAEVEPYGHWSWTAGPADPASVTLEGPTTGTFTPGVLQPPPATPSFVETKDVTITIDSTGGHQYASATVEVLWTSPGAPPEGIAMGSATRSNLDVSTPVDVVVQAVHAPGWRNGIVYGVRVNADFDGDGSVDDTGSGDLDMGAANPAVTIQMA